MNEFLLLLLIVALLFISSYFFSKIKMPMVYYVRILGAIFLVVFVWLFGDEETKMFSRGMMTLLALTSIFRTVIDLNLFNSI